MHIFFYFCLYSICNTMFHFNTLVVLHDAYMGNITHTAKKVKMFLQNFSWFGTSGKHIFSPFRQ